MKKKFIKIKSVSHGSFYVEYFETELQLCSLLDGADAGEENGYIVSIVEMTQDEYDALPEFKGF